MKSLFTIIFCIIASVSIGQVTGVDYLMKYNCETNQYDVKLVILSGSASTIPQRAQFNSQISVVVPTGEIVEITANYMPLQNNQNYNGITPLNWTLGNGLISPEAQPDNDFYGITPTLSPASFYNDLEAGDIVTLFSFTAGTKGEYDAAVRFFQNGVDPDITALGGGNYSNGFTMGGSNQLYNSNSTVSCLTDVQDELLINVNVYPNPFQDQIFIEVDNDIHKLKIIGPEGKIYYHSKSPSKGIIELNAEAYPSGLYFLIIESNKGVSNKKIIRL